MSPPRKPPRRTSSAKHRRRMLFTCVGRRVELVRAFREAAGGLGCPLQIHGADASRFAPAIHRVDNPHIVPPISSGHYVEALLEIVRKHKIDLLIPLLDPELPLIAASRERFADVGCLALVSSQSVVETCRDKLAAFQMLRKSGIDTPKTWLWREALSQRNNRYPMFLKPRTGSAAMGNYKVAGLAELRTLGRRVPDPIVQEFVEGPEHTLDVYTGLDGKPRCVVPRKRLEVRTGEVSKGLIVKNPAIMAVGKRVAEALRDCRGVITVQCIVTPRGRIRVIEINPRFGGGVPLAIHAGADFPKWILAGLLGRKIRINPTGYRGDVVMLRYDESVFVPGAAKSKTNS